MVNAVSNPSDCLAVFYGLFLICTGPRRRQEAAVVRRKVAEAYPRSLKKRKRAWLLRE